MASTNPGALIVRPPGASTNELPADIRGLKGPVEIPTGWEWVWWLLGAVAAAIVAWRVYKWWRKRQLTPKAAVVIPAHRRAKDRLRGALDLISNPYAYCSLLSDVVRGYIEDRFNYKAPERTTEEFLAEVQTGTRLTLEQQALLSDFLQRCDLVKFAKHEPAEPELRALYDAALKFIDETAETAPVAVSTEEAQR